ncbi:MAG: hypothetical protein ACI8VC_001162 [Candidatus Endobugula sp.]|jgi:hypothetical protein
MALPIDEWVRLGVSAYLLQTRLSCRAKMAVCIFSQQSPIYG